MRLDGAAILRWVDEVHLEAHLDPSCERCLRVAASMTQHVGG